jgi:hypothetical protein
MSDKEFPEELPPRDPEQGNVLNTDPAGQDEVEKAAMIWFDEYIKYVGKDDDESKDARAKLSKAYLDRKYPMPPLTEKEMAIRELRRRKREQDGKSD